jgi:hypothetical protein
MEKRFKSCEYLYWEVRRENIYDDHIYVEKILEKATRLRRKNIVDAFDNSGGVD